MTEVHSDVQNSWSVRSIVRTMIPLLFLLTVLELGSGTVLDSLQRAYLDNPSLLILVPAMIDMGGNLGSILAARLSTQLHLGTIDFDLRHPDRTIVSNSFAILGLSLTTAIILGLFAFVVGGVIGNGSLSLGMVLFISVSSSLLLAVLVIITSVSATWMSYRYGFDPDDTAIPIVTNVSDIAGVLILSGIILVVL